VSKIVIGALTAAVWFALCYVARAEVTCGPIGDHGSCIVKYVGHPLSAAALLGPGIEMRRGSAQSF
jgi:hypothetical protein